MKGTVLVVVVGLLFACVPGVQADEGIIDRVEEACEAEITAYCSQVTRGEGRLLACFYAHGDKLSGRCEYALYEGVAELDQFVTALTHVATQCDDDLTKFCADVEIGEGRVGACLLEHKSEVSEACAQAMVDTEMEVVDE